MTSAALDGVRVLDLADRSAALAGRILADLGAEVILVEPPGGGSIRSEGPFLDGDAGPERGFAHQYLNANKRSVVLDIHGDADDRARFLALAATADVVIDTEAPGQLDELGLDHHTLRAVNPGLIQISVTPFGPDGPWRDRVANDLVAGATGGLIWLSGEPRSTPVQGGANPSYTMASLAAASAATIALTARNRGADETGQPLGAHIDVSLQEATAMAAMQTATPSLWTWHGRIPRRPGLSNALRCADGGHVGLLVRPDRFDSFLEWCDRVGIDHDMTTDDWEWSLLTAPRKNNPVAAATLALAAALSRDEFAEGALEADLVCLPVLGFADLETHEQYVVNEQFLEVRHDGLDRELGFVRSPVDAMADGVTFAPAPTVGEHQAMLDEVPPLNGSVPSTPLEMATPTPADSDPATALAGIRVVDLGWVLAAPIGTRILASFGAEVIRVESASKPDSMRSQPGPDGKPDSDLGGLFNSVNAGKKSLAVKLTEPRGLALLKELIATADVVVNNFRPGAMDRMGLGFDVLRSLNPKIVSLNLPGAHRKGPWAVRSSMGNILMAASGFNMLTGFDGERPRGMGIAYPDFTSPHLLTATILAALRQRDTTGEGQELHLTQLSGMVSLLGVEWMEYAATGMQPPRRANRDPNYCPHGIYPAAGSADSDDEWVAIAVADDQQWSQLCELIGQPELSIDHRFASHELRKANEDQLDELIGAWTVALDKWDCAERCQAVGIAAGPVEHLADTYERDPQLRHHYQTVHQPSAPSVDVPIDREPAQWRGADHRLERAPGMGEHNEHVVRDLIGYTDDDYIQLVIDGVLE
jgi:crotonobetainyl-CoA:carnitine CoA-transferase CaiB-like acyl-CoA transferase